MKKTQQYNDYILSTLLTFVPKAIMILTASFPLRVTGDELFLFYLPAKLAGLDWTGSMYDYRYYGYGFNILLTPLFKWIEEPAVLYRVCLIIVAVIQVLVPVICCYLLRNFFHSNHWLANTIISLICAYTLALYPTYMYNEHIYAVCIWISFFWLYKLLETENHKKRKLLYSAALGLSFAYALAIHQRAVTLVVAFCIVYVLSWIMFRKSIAYFVPVVGIYFIFSCIHQKIVAWNVNFLAVSSSGIDKIDNIEVDTVFSFSWFRDFDYSIAFIRTFVGNLNNWNIFSVGTAAFTVVLGIYLLSRFFAKKKTAFEKKILVIGMMGILCIGITIFGLATSGWGWGIRDAYVENNASSDKLRGLIYLRYFVCYYPPILLAVLAFFKDNQKVCKEISKYALILSLFMMICWVKLIIVPLLTNHSVGLGSLQAFSFSTFETSKEITGMNYVIGILFISILALLIVYLYTRRGSHYAFTLILIVLFYQYAYNAYLGDGRAMLYNNAYSDAATKVIQELNHQEVFCPIYVQDPASVPETGQKILFQLQFMNMHNSLLSGMPPFELEEAIWIAYFYNEENDLLFEHGYSLYQLDDNEYAYVKGRRLLKYFDDYTLIR